MPSTHFTREQVITLLKQDYSLAYFYLEGGVVVQDKEDEPLKEGVCPDEVFLALRKEGLITLTDRKQHGFPYYADRAKYDVYRITAKEEGVIT
jgi:hypothetical protein